MKAAAFALVLIFLFLSGCISVEKKEGDITMVFEQIDFKTSDGFVIKGNLFRGGEEAVLLLHMLNSNKESYTNFAEKLNKAGFTVLAIDFRGHGESLQQKTFRKNWNDFKPSEFNEMILDAEGANDFLTAEGFKLKKVVGASIGANVALNYSADNSAIEKVVLLSPGLDYRGVTTEDAAMKTNAMVLIVASEEDSYSFGSSGKLETEIANSEFKKLRNTGHGTAMLVNTQIDSELVEWLKG